MNDGVILQELAKQYREISEHEVNEERRSRCQRINDLIPDRPPVWIDEIPWNEMDIDGQLTLTCSDPFARDMERFFRQKLFRWKYFQADMVLEKWYPLGKSRTFGGIGVQIEEQTVSTDTENHIVSHHYEDQLDSFEKVERLHPPVIKADKEADQKRLEKAEELLGGILPVRLLGNYVYFSPWDEISMLRGVEPVLIDMMERPELIHATMKKYQEIGMAILDQMEEEDLFGFEQQSLHCTPSYVSKLPSESFDGKKVRAKDIWFRGMAQMLSSVSPSMFDEFELSYMKPLFERCGLVYYGCCEPLDNRISLLKTVPNLRKLGVSPWADLRKCAEQIGGDYVYARKPNPAAVAMKTDLLAVKKEITDTLSVCREYGCPCEFVLKDISTVGHNPQNLIDWNRAAQEAIDEFYS